MAGKQAEEESKTRRKEAIAAQPRTRLSNPFRYPPFQTNPVAILAPTFRSHPYHQTTDSPTRDVDPSMPRGFGKQCSNHRITEFNINDLEHRTLENSSNY